MLEKNYNFVVADPGSGGINHQHTSYTHVEMAKLHLDLSNITFDAEEDMFCIVVSKLETGDNLGNLLFEIEFESAIVPTREQVKQIRFGPIYTTDSIIPPTSTLQTRGKNIATSVNGIPADSTGNIDVVGGLLDITYPVGPIYMSVNTTNPSSMFGGTWMAWGTGRVPVGVDTSQTEFDVAESTGGHKSMQSHSHGFNGSVNSAGAHTHEIGLDYGAQASDTNRVYSVHSDGYPGAENDTKSHLTSSNGSHTHVFGYN